MKVFIFAHQDDEIFALPYVFNLEEKLFFYLTNGVSANADGKALRSRSLEAKEVFERHLSGLNAEVNWWGQEHSIPEGELHKFVSRESILQVARIIRERSAKNVQLVTTTFEGAHQDHDASAIFSRELGKVLGVEVIEVATYRQWLPQIYSFRVMKPRQRNQKIDFPRGKVLALAIKLIWGYRTQRITWLGLAMATITTYAFRTYYSARPVQASRIKRCFYETRGRSQQTEVLDHLNASIT